MLTNSDFTLILTGTSDLTITLPNAAANTGRIYVIKNLCSGRSSSSTSVSFIDESGSNSSSLSTNRIYWLQSDGTNWQQIIQD